MSGSSARNGAPTAPTASPASPSAETTATNEDLVVPTSSSSSPVPAGGVSSREEAVVVDDAPKPSAPAMSEPDLVQGVPVEDVGAVGQPVYNPAYAAAPAAQRANPARGRQRGNSRGRRGRSPQQPIQQHPHPQYPMGAAPVAGQVFAPAAHPPLQTFYLQGRRFKGFIVDSMWDERDRSQVTRFMEVMPDGGMRIVMVRQREDRGNEDACCAGVAAVCCFCCLFN